MSTDPASINIDLRISGLDRNEAAVVLHAVPAGRSVTFDITQPAIGGPRYAVTLTDLSSVQVRDLLTAHIDAAEAVWNSSPEASGDR